MLFIKELRLWQVLPFYSWMTQSRTTQLSMQNLPKMKFSIKLEEFLHSSPPNLFTQQTLQSQPTNASHQSMNQFRFHKGPHTAVHNDTTANYPLHPPCFPPLTAITSISYSTITRPCVLHETSFVLGVIFIADLLLFCAIHGPFHPNVEI